MHKHQYKKRHFLPIYAATIAILWTSLFACKQKDSKLEQRETMISQIDSLWTQLNGIRQNFVFGMDVFEERKLEMSEQLIRANFLKPEDVTEEIKGNFDQYQGIYKIYKSAGKKYKNAVLEAENLYYVIKGLEQEVKKGNYDSQTESFKKECAQLKSQLDESAKHTSEVTEKLSSVEPTYMRINDKLIEFLDQKLPEKGN
jgi:hypothetical protein